MQEGAYFWGGGEGLPVSNLSVFKNQIGFVILSDLNSDTVLSLD